MKTGATKPDTCGVQRKSPTVDEQGKPDQPNRKRHRTVKDDEDAGDLPHERPTTQESLNKPRRNPRRRVRSQPSRKGPPPRETRDLEQQDRSCKLTGQTT